MENINELILKANEIKSVDEVTQSVETVIQKIEEGLREKKKVNIKGNEYDMNMIFLKS